MSSYNMNILTNEISLSVIIPFKNEARLMSGLAFRPELQSSPSVEFIYVDDGSIDGGGEELKRLIPTAKVLRLLGLGTGRAFLAGAENAKGRYILLLPIDCSLTLKAMQELGIYVEHASARVLVFPKCYSSMKALGFYAFAQNMVLLRWLKMASWTNGFVLRRDLIPVLQASVQEVFLNDLELSRQLKKLNWQVLNHKISVSPRRYSNDGAIKRIFLNGLIVFLWQFRLVSAQRLLQIYKRGKNE